MTTAEVLAAVFLEDYGIRAASAALLDLYLTAHDESLHRIGLNPSSGELIRTLLTGITWKTPVHCLQGVRWVARFSLLLLIGFH